MSNSYTFGELIEEILAGGVSEGTEFSTKSGEKIIYKYGALSWMTASKYLTSPLSITAETLADTYTVIEEKTKPISFYEALEILSKEQEEVMVVVDSNEYTLKEMNDVDDLIAKEYFQDLYKGKFYVALPEEDSK